MNILENVGLNITTVLLAIITFVLLFTTVKRHRKSNKNLPPGPGYGLPILGHLAQLDPKAPYKSLDRLARKYGPVFLLQFGSFPVIILNDLESIRQVFIKQGNEFDDRPKLLVFEIGNSGKGVIRTHSSFVQRIRRRFSLSALRDLGMGKFRLEEQIAEEIDRMTKSIAKPYGKPFSLFRTLDMLTCNVICCLVFGHGFSYDDPKLLRILHFLEQIFKDSSFTGLANFVPWMSYLPFSGLQNIKRLSATTSAFYKEMIKIGRENHTPDQPHNFIDMYFDNQEKIKNEQADISEWFDDEDLENCISDLFGAGTETSSTTLKWGILYMILQPEIQVKVQAELDAVVGRERMPSLKDRARLPYTEATLLEMQRMGSITPLGVPRAANMDTTIKGYDVPKGTVVFPNLWAVHHDADIWNDPEVFMSERFLNSDGTVNRREELIPFSLGKRKCLGEQLALTELFLIFSHLLHKLTFSIPDGATPSVEPVIGATLVPTEYEVIVLPRD